MELKKTRFLILITAFITVFLGTINIVWHFEKITKKEPEIKKTIYKDDFKIEWFLDNMSISDSIVDVLYEYPEFARTIKSANIKLPMTETMIPQGIAYIPNEFIIITAYDYKKDKNSKCYVLDLSGEIVNEVSLDTKSHVGAIVYDEANDVMWIPDAKGILNIYNVDDILNKKNVVAKQKFDYVSDGLINYKSNYGDYIDYMCLKDGHIFIGNFRTKDKGLVKKYKIENVEGEIVLKLVHQFNVPTLVQGITFYKKDDREFMILSKSFGRRKKSKLEIYEYDENLNDYTDGLTMITRISLPPMLEQITANGENLLLLFESNAKKYDDGKDKIDVICVLALEKILSK